jgi:phosphomannomutase
MASGSPALIATHSGVRGRPGAELSPAVVQRTVAGLIGVIEERGLPRSIAIARDERASGAELGSQAIAAALELGADVVDLGVAPTPAAKLAARRRGLGGALIVTGSHLDPALNGLKLVAGPHYGPLDTRGLPAARAASRGQGSVRSDRGASAEHVAAVLESVDRELLRRASLSVRCSGSAGPGPRRLLEELGCGLGTPQPEIGLRLDADGDRLQLLDERGDELDPEMTLALVVLARGARSIVKGADTSRIVDELAAERGGRVLTVPPGEIHLISALTDEGGELAGEGNGGVIIPEVGLARDGLAAAVSVLGLLARERRPLSAIVAGLPSYARVREAVSWADRGAAAEAIAGLAERLGLSPPDSEYGLRVEAGAGTWALVRVSATERVIRFTVEAPEQAQAESLHAELRAGLEASAP